MENIFIMYGIALLSIILGFIALLTQKVYIDRETNQPTELEVPFLGKMKTNFPALVFVIIGFVLSYTTFDKSYKKQVGWTVTGSFEKPVGDTTKINWREEGTLSLIPAKIRHDVLENGTFTIFAEINEGEKFEDVFEVINYSHKSGAVAHIVLEEQYRSYMNGQETLIESATKTTRKFKPIPVNVYKFPYKYGEEP